MKLLFLIILCFFAITSSAQTGEAITEEKSSAWIKILEDPVVVSKQPVKKTTTTIKRKTSTQKPATPKREAPEEFEKTNQQVNRFKKGKKTN